MLRLNKIKLIFNKKQLVEALELILFIRGNYVIEERKLKLLENYSK
jgi:hypothetical protein